MGEVLLRPAHTETPILSLRLLSLHFLVRRLLFVLFLVFASAFSGLFVALSLSGPFIIFSLLLRMAIHSFPSPARVSPSIPSSFSSLQQWKSKGGRGRG